MTYAGMQHINMTSTMLQEARKDKLSFFNKLIRLMNLILKLVKKPYLIKRRLILPILNLQSSFSSSEPQKPNKIFIPNQLWGEFPEAAEKLIIDYNKKLKWLTQQQHFNVGNPKPKPQQVHFHENDHSPDSPHPEDSTQAILHECLTDAGIDPSNIDTDMSGFQAKNGKPTQDSPRKIKRSQNICLARRDQSTNNFFDRGANGGLAGADMKILDRKINIVGIDDHELTGLDVVTATACLIPREDVSLGLFMSMLTLAKEDLFMLLSRWNGSTERLMTDPSLLEVLRELKPLMDMFSHSPLILVWFTCTPSECLLMMTFSNTLMVSLHHLTFGILWFWTMVLHLLFLMKFTKKLVISCSQILC